MAVTPFRVYNDPFQTETWLSDKILDNEILPYNYSIIRKDRQSRGGGVMFAIKHSNSYQVLPSPPDLELYFTISIGSATPTIYCLYSSQFI